MKTRIFLTVGSLLLLCVPLARGDDETELHRTAENMNQQSATHEGERRVLHSIGEETGVRPATLLEQKRATGYGNGELLIANLLARASGRSFDEIAAMRKTEGWGKLAHDLGLNLGHIVSRAHRAEQASHAMHGGGRGPGPGNQPGHGHGRGHRS